MRKDALAVLIGVTGIQFAPSLPHLSGWVFAAAFAGSLLFLQIGWRTGLRTAAFLVLGLLYAWARAQQDLSHRLPDSLEPLNVQATVEVVSLVEHRDYSSTFDARVLSLQPALPLRRVRVSWYRAPSDLQATQRWSLSLKLRVPRGHRNPGGFDVESAWGRAGIDALATLDGRSTPRLLVPASFGSVLAIRQFLAGELTRWAAGSPSAGVIAGLAVGDTSQISQDLWSIFRAVGITHLMAISGTHVGMFGMFAALIARTLWRLRQSGVVQRGAHRLCAVSAVAASLSYALLAGFSIPTQRTALMLAVVGVARMRARHLGASHVLSLAALAVLLLDPTAPLQPGFWLSFVTVAWIFMLSNDAANSARWRQELRMQIGVSLVVLPIGLYCFAQTSLIAPLVNLLAIPVAGLILVPAIILAASVAPLLPDMGQWIIQHLAACLDLLWPLLRAAGQWPPAQYWTSNLPLGLAVVAAVAAMTACLVPAWPWRGVAAAAFLSVFGWPAGALRTQEFDVAILDAGDALAAVLLTSRSTVIYYRGGSGGTSTDVAASVVLPYLRWRGRDQVDLLVLGHVDGASVGGMDALFRELHVGQVVGGGDSQAPCLAGQRFDRDGVAIRMLAPLDLQAEGRDASCMLWLGNSWASVLLPGDLAQATENTLVGNGAVWPATLVVVPARGSHKSSSPLFIDAVHARWAVVAAAHLNRFGYPRPEVIARWREAGAQVRQVSLDGATILRSRADGSVNLIPGERLTNRRYWTAK